MLVLTRKLGEEVIIPELGVRFTILGVKGNRVRVGIAAPPTLHIHRGEVQERDTRFQNTVLSGDPLSDTVLTDFLGTPESAV